MRRRTAFVIAILVAVSRAAGQEVTASDAVANWTAPPFWSAPAKPAGEKEGFGVLNTDVVDVVPSPPMPFVATNPCRIADSRAGQGFSGQAGPPAISVGVTRTFQVGGTVPGIPLQCGIPLAAQAVSFQFTVTGMNSAGNLIAWPEGAPPTTSVLNWNANSVAIGSGTVVGLSGTGALNVQLNGNAGAATELIIDVNGYYAPISMVNTLNGISGAVTLAAGSNISITPSSQTLTIANTAPAAWSLTGNAGITPGTHFLGTTDTQSLELRVNNQRVMRFELPPPTSPQIPNLISGYVGNSVTSGVYAATLLGGAFVPNLVTDSGGTVGGGSNNRAGDNAGTTTDRLVATVGGGNSNIAGGAFATVPGGQSNEALGAYSFAAGRRAKANHDGAFVWGDSTDLDLASTAVNQFIVRASGGIWLGTTSAPSIPMTDFLNTSTGAHLTTGGAWTNGSDFTRKDNFEEIDKRDVLARVAALPISRWSYKAEDCSVRHMGPTGQDFAAAFGLGTDDTSIATVDADGVALAAIQALYEEVQELRRRLAALEKEEDYAEKSRTSRNGVSRSVKSGR